METRLANPVLILGGHLQTKEAFTYGRFECSMKPAYGSGIISSFFTFYDGSDFRTNWNEIDFEFLGRNTNAIDTNIIRTVNGYTDKNINVKHVALNKRSSDVFWKITLEWYPDIVVWRVNDVVIRTMSVVLSRPQKLMMNIWADSSSWAGEFNRGLLPQVALYDYASYSKYINGLFVPVWRDDFNTIDLSRWMFGTWNQGQTTLVKENVSIVDSKLSIKLK